MRRQKEVGPAIRAPSTIGKRRTSICRGDRSAARTGPPVLRSRSPDNALLMASPLHLRARRGRLGGSAVIVAVAADRIGVIFPSGMAIGTIQL